MEEKDLSHFGIKGMRWGVRRESTSTSKEPTPVSVVTKSGSSKITTKGGERLPASEDAKKAAVAYQKLKKSGVSSLDTREMQVLVTRLNLEQQLSKLTEPQKSKFQKSAENAMNQAMGKAMSQLANQGVNLLMKQAMGQLQKKK